MAGLAGVALVGRVHEDTAAVQDAVDLGHQSGNPARVVVLAPRAGPAGQQLVDVALDRRIPVPAVGGVDGVFLRVRRDAVVPLGQVPGADLAVQREGGHAVAHGQHQHGRGTIDGIAGRNLLRAGLQEVLLGDMLHAFGRPQHREDRAHHRVDVDVGGTIQRVEQQQEFTLRIAVRNGVGLVHFLGGDGGQLPAPQIGFQQRVVGDHVQLLLGFPLHVLGAHITQIVVQGPLADGLADALAGAGHHFQQQAQLSGDQPLLALHLHQVLGEADVFLHDGRTPEREIGGAFQGAPGMF